MSCVLSSLMLHGHDERADGLAMSWRSRKAHVEVKVKNHVAFTIIDSVSSHLDTGFEVGF